VNRLLRNRAIVFTGNLAGALATAAIVFIAQQHTTDDADSRRLRHRRDA
jgi:hypothetical protein